MDNFKAQVAAKILEVLPEASDDVPNAVEHLVDGLGLQDISELAYITEHDLAPYLGVFKTRRLLQTWKETAAEKDSDDSERRRNPNPNPNLDETPEFLIDWEDLYRIDESVKTRLKAGKKLKSKQRRKVVERVVNQVRTKLPHAKRSIFREIIKSMKQKYPLSFKSELAKGKLDKRSLCHVMQVKFDNDRRPKRRTRMEQEAPAIKPAYGCKKWRLRDLPVGESEASLKLAQEQLLDYFEQTRPSAWDWTSIESLMEKTYLLQRQDINKQAEQLIEMTKKAQKEKRKRKNTENDNTGEEENPDDITLLTTEQIRDKWPFLFLPTCMINHFKTLTGTDLNHEVESFMRTKGNILSFLLETNKKGKPKKIRKKMNRAKELLPPNNAEMIGLLILLLDRFKENREALWLMVDTTAKEEDIPQLISIPKTPRIIIAGEDIFKPTTVYYSMDKQVLGTAENLLQGIEMLFASYFVFNLEYEADAQVTLEFFQRCIANINPDRGNKRPNKDAGGHSCNYAIHQYLKKFNRDFDGYLGDQAEDESGDED